MRSMVPEPVVTSTAAAARSIRTLPEPLCTSTSVWSGTSSFSSTRQAPNQPALQRDDSRSTPSCSCLSKRGWARLTRAERCNRSVFPVVPVTFTSPEATSTITRRTGSDTVDVSDLVLVPQPVSNSPDAANAAMRRTRCRMASTLRAGGARQAATSEDHGGAGGEVDHRARHQPEGDGESQGDGQCRGDAKRYPQPRRGCGLSVRTGLAGTVARTRRVAHVHQHRHPQVEKRRDGGGQHADDG